MRRYADDNDGVLPLACEWFNIHPAWAGSVLEDWCGWQLVGNSVYPDTSRDVMVQKGSLWPYVKNRWLYICPSDKGRKAPRLTLNSQNALSYSMNWYLHVFRMDAIHRPTKTLLLIHEDRNTINDGLLVWDPNLGDLDAPDNVHYDGTTVVFADGHSKWVNQRYLQRVRYTDEWKGVPNQRDPRYYKWWE